MTSPKNKPDAERARRPLVLEWSLVVLAAAAVAVLAAENCGVRPREAHGAEFQHLVGGLGLGPSVTLSPCSFALDPRLDDDCAADADSIPGGRWFCSQHALSVFAYPPLHRREARPAQRRGDGQVP